MALCALALREKRRSSLMLSRSRCEPGRGSIALVPTKRGGSGAMSTLFIVSAAALSEKAGPQLCEVRSGLGQEHQDGRSDVDSSENAGERPADREAVLQAYSSNASPVCW